MAPSTRRIPAAPTPSEAALQAAWAALGHDAADLVTQEGERLTVLFPGMLNRGPGPDFQGAIIETERGRIVRGDVEVHREPGGWRDHGHATDPRYDGVVLHVVGTAGTGAITVLPNGGRLPVAQLPPTNCDGGAAPAGHPCEACRGRLAPEALAARLTELGLERLRRKAAAWRHRLQRAPADDLVYRACLEALGYPANRAPLLQLAGALPWAAVVRSNTGLLQLQAQLLGRSGWLDRRPPLPPALLAALRECREPAAAPLPDSLPAWQLGACRPAAHPARRLLGAAVWLQGWQATGPAAWLEAVGATPAKLGAAFTVSAADAGLSGPAPIGAGRAAVVALNVAYPFLLALAGLRRDASAAAAITQTYCRLPPLEGDGVVRPLLTALGVPELRLTACQQQGLHHLFRRSCRRGRQARCLLSPSAE